MEKSISPTKNRQLKKTPKFSRRNFKRNFIKRDEKTVAVRYHHIRQACPTEFFRNFQKKEDRGSDRFCFITDETDQHLAVEVVTPVFRKSNRMTRRLPVEINILYQGKKIFRWSRTVFWRNNGQEFIGDLFAAVGRACRLIQTERLKRDGHLPELSDGNFKTQSFQYQLSAAKESVEKPSLERVPPALFDFLPAGDSAELLSTDFYRQRRFFTRLCYAPVWQIDETTNPAELIFAARLPSGMLLRLETGLHRSFQESLRDHLVLKVFDLNKKVELKQITQIIHRQNFFENLAAHRNFITFVDSLPLYFAVRPVCRGCSAEFDLINPTNHRMLPFWAHSFRRRMQTKTESSSEPAATKHCHGQRQLWGEFPAPTGDSGK